MSTRPITEAAKRRFLEHLATSLDVTASARAAGHHRASFYRLRDDDEDFATAWQEALDEATDALEARLYKIASEGAEERVYDAAGDLVSSRIRDDAKSILAQLAAHRPERYSERRRLELSGAVEIAPTVDLAGRRATSLGDVVALAVELGALPRILLDAAAGMPAEARAQLLERLREPLPELEAAEVVDVDESEPES